jgi:hypothetical protein
VGYAAGCGSPARSPCGARRRISRAGCRERNRRPPRAAPPQRGAAGDRFGRARFLPALTPANIIVTNRGTGIARGALERSYSASRGDAVELARRDPAALADVLATLPGVWADRSAGTAADTIRVRGIRSTAMR